MNLPSKLLTAAALAAATFLYPASTEAQQVDAVLNINIQLNTVSQGPVTTVGSTTQSRVVYSSITTRDVIRALGAAEGTTFSRQAKLVLLTPTNNLDLWTVQVRDGSRKVDVTGFFVHQAGSAEVDGAWVNNRNGNAGENDYSLDAFALQDPGAFQPLGIHFAVSGLTVTSQQGIVRRGQITGQTSRISARVSGAGDVQGNLILIEGNISAEGSGTETVDAPPPIDVGV